MSWLLAGFRLETGFSPDKDLRSLLPEPDPGQLGTIREKMRRWVAALSVRLVDEEALRQFAEDGARSTYLLDVRTREEFRAGHLPGWRHSPGGQLVQATDRYVGTQNARIVLADWDGVRAQATAAWLTQAGQGDVCIYPVPAGAALATGDSPLGIPSDPERPAAPWVSAGQALVLAQKGATIYDIDNSARYFRKHIAGAKFVAPHRLPELLAGARREILLASRDGVLAKCVAGALLRRGIQAKAILGGSGDWFRRQLPAETGGGEILTGEEDMRYSGYEYAQGAVRENLALRDRKFSSYLQWELDLPEQIKRLGAGTSFRDAPA
jgi:rhodanese-related sulfurtransferase